MTFKQFTYLDEDEQEVLLWERGVELFRNKDDFYHYILYQVDGFYMEVKYVMPQRTIIEILCFDDIKFIDSYLERIKIDSLFAAL